MEEFFYADCKSLLVQFNHQGKQLNLKRRWLAGLPMSRDELRQFNGPKSEHDRTVPESLLREDDVYYETVRTVVEKRLKQCNNAQQEQKAQHAVQNLTSPNNKETIFYLLDKMTNTALCQFAEALTRGSMKFKKTRSKMKKIIKEFLPKVLNNENVNHDVNTYKQLCEILKDPQNFCRTLYSSEFHQSERDAALMILDRLEDFPTQALTAMHRRLKGIKRCTPQLDVSTKRGTRRDILIQKVKEFCTEMLADEGDDERLQEPLAEAMTVASFTLKLLLGCDSLTNFKFKRVSADVEYLQNEIANAIWVINRKGKFDDVDNLRLLLDPNSKLSNKKLQVVVNRVLTECLFECNDLKSIPEWLLEALAIINKSSHNCRTEEMQESNISKDVDEEVECIISFSALIRQVVWDLFPDYGFDQDFSDAYMEDLEESDDGENCEDEVESVKNISGFCAFGSKDQMESIGDTNFGSKVRREPVEVKLESMDAGEMEAADSYPSTSSSSCLDSKDVDFCSYTASISVHGKLNKIYAKNMEHSIYSLNSKYSGNCKANSIDSGTCKANSIDSGTCKANSTDSGTCKANSIDSGTCNFMHDEQSGTRNKYLVVQEASDETSMVAYHLIGCLLENFAQRDGMDLDDRDISYLRDSNRIPRSSKGTQEKQASCKEDDCDSIIFEAVGELIPSFTKRGQERLKQLLGSNPNSEVCP